MRSGRGSRVVLVSERGLLCHGRSRRWFAVRRFLYKGTFTRNPRYSRRRRIDETDISTHVAVDQRVTNCLEEAVRSFTAMWSRCRSSRVDVTFRRPLLIFPSCLVLVCPLFTNSHLCGTVPQHTSSYCAIGKSSFLKADNPPLFKLRREPGPCYEPSNVREIDHYDSGGLMFRAGIMLNGRTHLYVIVRGTKTAVRHRDELGLAIHQNDHQARRRFVEWAQNEIAVVPNFHKRILFSDEAHFWLNGYVNKQNCRIWSEANPQVYAETPLHPEKLTVWCALWAGGILLQKR
ncbi:uncharacterized protein TNCV_3997601 [Trichonephila clavipes]|nr:uncharacterized protein TNCV_3997601 [Trichonephila clavipes]